MIEDVQKIQGLRSFRAEGVRCAVVVPVRVGDQALGAILVGNRTPRPIDPEQIRLLQVIGAHMGIAIQKARMMEETIRAYAALRNTEEQRARLVEILDQTPDFVSFTDAQLRRQYLNLAGRRLLGLPAEGALPETTMLDNRPEWVRALLRDVALPAAEKDGVWTGEAAFLDRDGREVPVTQVIIAHRTSSGQLRNFSVVARDISARKEVELQLEQQFQSSQRAQAETRAILDAASDAMALLSLDGRILSVNRRIGELFGAETPNDPIGQEIVKYELEVQRIFANPAQINNVMAESLVDPERRFSTIVAQAWPERRELLMSSSPVRTDTGEYLGRLFSFRDVTHEREVDRMKTEFVSLVSHELRTPLTSIKGYVDLLLDNEVGELAPEQREFLETVGSNADRLVGLINDLLDVARIESGKIELKRASLDLSRIIAGVTSALRPQLEAKLQVLTVNVPDPLPTVNGDADRVTQIVLNLLSNAHKYTPVGGSIVVNAAAEAAFIRVSVSDTGIGLSPDEQAQLFKKFYRAKNRATEEVGGTGLGLVITRSLVEMHGGEISVSSEPNAGSTFSFTLPASAEQRETDCEESKLGVASGHILVVDDDHDIATLIGRYLRRAGYAVTVAHTAGEALRLARETRPDVITLDRLLPDVDGLTLLKWLKNDVVTRAIPVLILSVLPPDSNETLLGSVEHLTKPVNEHALLDTVRRAFEDRPARRVLVADDDPDARGLITDLLVRSGYEVIQAADGHEAVTIAQRERLDLALIDVRMPRSDGFSALREIRADSSLQGLPIIMMSVSPGVLEYGQTLVEELGGSVLLSKPCTSTELAHAVGMAMAQRVHL